MIVYVLTETYRLILKHAPWMLFVSLIGTILLLGIPFVAAYYPAQVWITYLKTFFGFMGVFTTVMIALAVYDWYKNIT